MSAATATHASAPAGAGDLTAVPLALYVHLPWCVRKCPYCDFNSHQLKSARPERGYVDALLADLERDAPLVAGRTVETVFFGGGTPSLFSPEDYARLLAGVRARIELAADAEITLEANPGAVERGAFAGYRDAGINRVSLGVQSFSPVALERLGRVHGVDDVYASVEELHTAGLVNFNLDLMYALPQQSLAEAHADLAAACRLGPAHLSYYQLTLEPGTVFHARPPALPDEDTAWAMHLEGRAALAQAGFERYEVSAYARPGRQCRHNLNYWRFGDYLGIGAGAHGKITTSLPAGILRTEKPKQPRDFLAHVTGGGASPAVRRPIAVADLPFEFMLNALRLDAGFAAAEFAARTGLDPATLAPALDAAQRRGLLTPTTTGWRPTELGARFLNDLQASFLP